MNTTPDKPKDYGELSAPDLAKLINEEYSVILAGERNTFQRALAIGEKLVWLRTKAVHGEWQKKLKDWCPNLSYETATLYIRLVEKRHIWEPKARAESVASTDLTIEKVRQLLAKPKPKPNNDPDPESDADAEDGDGQKHDDLEEDDDDRFQAKVDEEITIEWLRTLAPDELIGWLRTVQDDDWLSELTKLLATHLGMVLMPIAQSKALYEALGSGPVDAEPGEIDPSLQGSDTQAPEASPV